MIEFSLVEGIIAVPVLIGLLEVIKRVSGMDEKYIPILSVLIGVVVSCAFQFYGETDMFIAIIRGVAVGLSAVGLFSGGKNTLEGLGVIKDKSP